jgi:hypothetical protein
MLMSQISGINRNSRSESLIDRLATVLLGSLNVGRYTLRVGAEAGALLEPIGQPTNLVAKPLTTLKIPPAPRRFLGHEAALNQAIVALKAGQSVEIVGAAGVGKSAFLRQLAHHPDVTTSHSDGILHFATIEPIGDLMQSLGETFYHLYPESYLSESEWRLALADCQALIMVNAPGARSAALLQLRQLLPQSTFVVASAQPRLAASGWPGELAVLTLQSPDLVVSQQLVADVLGRSLTMVEQAQLAQLWQCFRGESARLIQLAECLREQPQAWDDWAVWLTAHPKPDRVVAHQRLVVQLMADLDTPQRWILGLLTALDGVSLTIGQIAAITGPQDPRSSLQRLMRLGLIQVVEQRYRVVEPLQGWLTRQFATQPWMERGLVVMQDWLTSQTPETIGPELPVLIGFLRWAVAEKRSAAVLAIARLIDSALILGKQWEQWGRVLQWALQAAWQLEDERSEAWAWHQLGTRALLLDDITTAYDALQQAWKLRQGRVRSAGAMPSAADMLAIALTEANRAQVIQSAVPTPKQAEVRATAADQQSQQTYGALLVISLVTFMVALLVGLGIRSWVAPSPRSEAVSRLGAAGE